MHELYLEYLSATRAGGATAAAGLTLTRFPCTLGRHPDCDLTLADPAVSRRHCAFSLRGGEVWVEDLGSRNGTYLNGQPVREAQPVRDGDWLGLAFLSFRARLPARPDAPAVGPVPAGGARGPAGTAHDVLVVEDNADAALTLALLLAEWGHEVRVARDGPEALRAARERPPDAVLLDIRLPWMDGYQVARRLRSEAGLGAALVVGITGYAEEGGERRARETGIDCVLSKPVDPAALQGMLGRPR